MGSNDDNSLRDALARRRQAIAGDDDRELEEPTRANAGPTAPNASPNIPPPTDLPPPLPPQFGGPPTDLPPPLPPQFGGPPTDMPPPLPPEFGGPPTDMPPPLPPQFGGPPTDMPPPLPPQFGGPPTDLPPPLPPQFGGPPTDMPPPLPPQFGGPPTDMPPPLPPQFGGPPTDMPPPLPPQFGGPPTSTPPPAPLLSEKGEPVKPMPGWTPDQSKIYQDLSDKMGKIAQGYGQSLGDIRKATPEQAQNASRLVQGNPAMLNIPDELKQIAGSNVDQATKDQRAQDAFARVAKLNDFVTDLQQKTGLNNNGVKMLPLLNEAQSKAFADRGERMREALTGFDDALDPKRAAKLGPAEQKTAVELARANGYMLDVPRQLKEIEKTIQDPAERAKAVDRVMAPMGDIDKKLSVGERDLAGNKAEQLLAEQKANAPKPGFFSRLAERIQSIPDRIRAAINPEPPAPPLNLPTFAPNAPPIPNSPPPQTNAQTVTQNGQALSNAPTIPNAPPLPNSSPPNVPGKDEVKSPAQGWQSATPSQKDGPVIGRQRANAITERGQNGENVANHMTVEAGEAGYELKKGLGFSTGGTVGEIKHLPDGKTDIEYKVKGHDQHIKIDSVGADGKENPLAKAVESLNPGDAFKFEIGRDSKGTEVVHVEDKTTGKNLDVNSQGITEHKVPTQQQNLEKGGR